MFYLKMTNVPFSYDGWGAGLFIDNLYNLQQWAYSYSSSASLSFTKVPNIVGIQVALSSGGVYVGVKTCAVLPTITDGATYLFNYANGTVKQSTVTPPPEGEFNFTDLLPMFPWEGPPLPRVTGLTWEKIFGGFTFEIPLSKKK